MNSAAQYLLNTFYKLAPNRIKFHVHRKSHAQAAREWTASPFVLIHIPKSAGTSLNTAFGLPDLGHLTYLELQTYWPAIFHKERIYIAVIRDPMERLRSTYRYAVQNYRRKGWTSLADIAQFRGFDDFIREYVSAIDVRRHYFLRPSSVFVQGSKNNIILVDFTRLELAIEEINFTLSASISLPRLNTTDDQVDDLNVDGRYLERIEATYSEDYDLLRKVKSSKSGLVRMS